MTLFQTICLLTLCSDTLWRHRTGSILAQVMACCLMAPSHYLNQCWFLLSDLLWHSAESNFTVIAQMHFGIMSLKIILLKSLPLLPGANELIKEVHGPMTVTVDSLQTKMVIWGHPANCIHGNFNSIASSWNKPSEISIEYHQEQVA